MLSTKLKEKLIELEESKKVINESIAQIKKKLSDPVKCDKCGKVSKSLIYYEKHILSCQGNKREICEICRIDISDEIDHKCQCPCWVLDKNDSRGYSRCTKIFKSNYDKRTHMKCSGLHYKKESMIRNRVKLKECIPVPNIKMTVRSPTPPSSPEDLDIFYKLEKKHLEPLGIYRPNQEWDKLIEHIDCDEDLYYVYCANSLFLEDRPFKYVELKDLEEPVFILSDNKETFDLVDE